MHAERPPLPPPTSSVLQTLSQIPSAPGDPLGLTFTNASQLRAVPPGVVTWTPLYPVARNVTRIQVLIRISRFFGFHLINTLLPVCSGGGAVGVPGGLLQWLSAAERPWQLRPSTLSLPLLPVIQPSCPQVLILGLLSFIVFALERSDLSNRLGLIVTLFLASTCASWHGSRAQPLAAGVLLPAAQSAAALRAVRVPVTR